MTHLPLWLLWWRLARLRIRIAWVLVARSRWWLEKEIGSAEWWLRFWWSHTAEGWYRCTYRPRLTRLVEEAEARLDVLRQLANWDEERQLAEAMPRIAEGLRREAEQLKQRIDDMAERDRSST